MRLTQRNWSSSAYVLVAVIVDHSHQFVWFNFLFIRNHLVVSWTSCPLNCRVRIQVEVVLKGVSDILINNNARDRIAVLISGRSRWRKKSNMVALLCYNDSEIDLSVLVSWSLVQ